MVCWVAYLLIIVGALNWGLYGINQMDLVAYTLGSYTMAARVVYVLVGASAVIHLMLSASKE